jgi:lipopolysaccharide/colanic/teichoic acid biosynthesis glycosyltransferase
MKRVFDLIAIFFGLLFILPVIVVVAILVQFKIGTPIIFSQQRLGLNNHVFSMIKFRTMTNECDSNGNLLPDNVRLTKFGKFLRSISLDELPSLWSVLKGDMSLVGPRPLLLEYLPLYSEIQSRRHEVRPGITGWAQVNGRNKISWEKKFDMDVWYVENQSFWLDIKILLLTIKKIIVRDGITSQDNSTMPVFKGSNK